MRILIFVFFISTLIYILIFNTNQSFADKQCFEYLTNSVICAKSPYTGAGIDNTGRIVCGPGTCVKDSAGTVYCSTIAGGGAGLNSLGRVVCEGGCKRGNSADCVTLR
jgi:hypothetical protein